MGFLAFFLSTCSQFSFTWLKIILHVQWILKQLRIFHILPDVSHFIGFWATNRHHDAVRLSMSDVDGIVPWRPAGCGAGALLFSVLALFQCFRPRPACTGGASMPALRHTPSWGTCCQSCSQCWDEPRAPWACPMHRTHAVGFLILRWQHHCPLSPSARTTSKIQDPEYRRC